MLRLLTCGSLFAAAMLASAPSAAHPETPAGAHAATGAGRAGDPARVKRTVSIGMADSMRFASGAMAVKRGETVRIIARNDGAVMHEIVLGTREEIAALRASMKRARTWRTAHPTWPM